MREAQDRNRWRIIVMHAVDTNGWKPMDLEWVSDESDRENFFHHIFSFADRNLEKNMWKSFPQAGGPTPNFVLSWLPYQQGNTP